MSERILDDLRQTKPRRMPEEEAFVTLLRTADYHQQALTALLKTYGLTPPQYNVLRILRGAGAQGLPCGEISARMITRDPDITRLLDRMEARAWVGRTRDARDRRVITARIAAEGLRLVNALDAPVHGLLRRQLGMVGKQKLEKLVRLLEEIRGRDA
ncbi:MAG: MarR family transcriptional regulator [Bryobacteraceae bacterium]|nr:MarR family transcriptional regulator [Bryobacteraceae bacterium]